MFCGLSDLYDWAMVEWFDTHTSMHVNVPCKLLLFYRIEGSSEVWALVHCCGYESFNDGMFEPSRIISRHGMCFQRSSTNRSVPTLERIMVDSISHGVLAIEEIKLPDGKLDSVLTSTLPNHKVMVVADRKNEWASLFMEWGDKYK